AGMLMAVIAGIGAAQAGYSPDAATHFALAWVWAAIVGVIIVQLISWLIWPDLSPGFSTDGFRYRWVFPLARQQAAMARRCAAVLIIRVLGILTGTLPGNSAAVFSAIVIAAPPAISGGPIHKAFHRLLGLIIGGAYGITSLLILSHLPYLGMLLT